MRPESERVRVIVCGHWTGSNGELRERLDRLVANLHKPIIHTTDNKGYNRVDRDVQSWALGRGYTVAIFRPESDTPAAKCRENEDSVRWATLNRRSAIVVFRSGVERQAVDVKDLIERAKKANLIFRNIEDKSCPTSTSNTGRSNSRKSSGKKRQ